MDTTLAAPPAGAIPANGNGATQSRTAFWALTIGSVGVVYGDIGTSPLYAFREAVTAAAAGGTLTREAVLGVLSLILWALIVVVTLKYVLILLRADNKGEGGTLALMALAQRALGKSSGAIVLLRHHQRRAVLWRRGDHAGAVGAVGDRGPQGRDARHSIAYIVPLTVVILIALFAVQSRGTARVASFFGPITAVWFVAIAVPGVCVSSSGIPSVLLAFNPVHAVRFLGSATA